jgi:hypothetical protein
MVGNVLRPKRVARRARHRTRVKIAFPAQVRSTPGKPARVAISGHGQGLLLLSFTLFLLLTLGPCQSAGGVRGVGMEFLPKFNDFPSADGGDQKSCIPVEP